jgi:hypothetical protein
MLRFRTIAQCTGLMMALSLVCPSVQAAYVQLNSGLTNFTGALKAAGGSIAVNYTVFKKGSAGDNWTTSLLDGGTANVLGGSITGTESYVFFYQLHSNLGAAQALTKFAASGFFTGMGYVQTKAFKDPNLVGVQHIVPSYQITGPFTQPEVSLSSGATVQLDDPIGLSPLNQPQLVVPIGAGSNLDTTLHLANFQLNIGATNYTPVLFATSNIDSLALSWNTYGSINYGGSPISLASPNNSGGSGIAGTATPEPGTMILSAVGMSAFGGLGLLRRRRQKAEEKKA